MLAVALECARPILQARELTDGDDVPLVLPDSAGRSGPIPVLRKFTSVAAELRSASEAIQALHAEGWRLGEMAVLARQRWPLEKLQAMLERAGIAVMQSPHGRRGETPPEEAVTLTTLHSSKGLEFPVIFVIELNLLAGREEEFVEEARLLYVGMTRATPELHLSASAGGAFVEAVEGATSKL